MPGTFVTTNLTVSQSLATSTYWFLAEGASVYVNTGTAVNRQTDTSYHLNAIIYGDIVGSVHGLYFRSTVSGLNTGSGAHHIYIGETGSIATFNGDVVTTWGYNNEVINYGAILTTSTGYSGVYNNGNNYILSNFGTITGGSGVELTGPAGSTARVENSGVVDGHSFGIDSDARLFLNNSGTIIATNNAGTADGIHISSSASSGSVIRNSGTISGSGSSIVFDSSSNTVINTGELIGDVNFYHGENLFDGRGGTVSGAVFGGLGDDVLIGGDADDRFEGGAGADRIFGGAGSDTAEYTGSASSVEINLATGTGTTGDAVGDRLVSIENLVGSDWDDTLTGHGGVNDLRGGGGNDTLNGGNGADFLHGDGGHDTLFGGNGNDAVYGGEGNDTIDGGNDNDALFGGNGFDVLYGGAQNDKLYGGAQDDTLYGDDGDDVLWGDDGFDTLHGDNNDDTLHGGAGNDTLFGGAQNDTLYGDAAGDTLLGENGNDILNGGSGGDIMYGGNDNDVLNGDEDNDMLYGEGQSDTLDGGDGDDILDGGNGNDTLTGGADNDTLTGGNNSDDFIFANSFGVDVITDFNHWDANEDIDLSGNTAITDFADLTTNHLSFNGLGHAVITDGANTITLTGVFLGQLAADDFIF